MTDIRLVKEDLLHIADKLQKKNDLSGNVGPDYYEPGNMEYLDQYCGAYDENNNYKS